MIIISNHKNIRLITLDSPPVNALGRDLRLALFEHVEQAINDQLVRAIVIDSNLELFCAGADIQEFGSNDVWEEPSLPTLFQLLDSSPKVIVAAINGVSMGGGLELALACDYRIGREQAKFGLPEIKLGLLPGAGGTQRLPRITTLITATDMILSGEPISAYKALSIGLLNHVVADVADFRENVLAFTAELLANNAPTHNSAEMLVKHEGDINEFFANYKDNVIKKNQGQIAPHRCLDSLQAACQMPFADGLAQERVLFDELLASSQSRALRYLFFAERDVRKIPGVSRYTEPREIHCVAVIGAGLMGAGITISLLDAEIPVILLDMSDDNLSHGLSKVNNHYQRALEKKRLSSEEVERRLSMLSVSLEFNDLALADLVIETVFENLDVKKAVFEQMDEVCKPGAIMASNTSTLDLNAIAAVTRRPQDVVGMHFFSPANIMRLLEVVRCTDTSPEVIHTVAKLSKKLGKVSVVVNVCFGFVGNRMLEPYFREASRLMLEGASPMQIDNTLTEFGMAMGVISMGDLAGIDVGYRVRESRRDKTSHDPGYQAIQDKLYSLKRYGQKTGRGCYLYNGREKSEDPEVTELCRGIAKELGIEQRTISNDEILERCMFPLINEGYQILDEGIAYRSSDCDLIWVNGYGFPAWRGGPMRYADEVGPVKIMEGMQKYREQLGAYGEMWFKPAPLLERLAAQ